LRACDDELEYPEAADTQLLPFQRSNLMLEPCTW
jgi:hypothetical protein